MPLSDRANTKPSSKPITPALSTHFRAIKSPITPKLAASSESSPVISPRRDALVRGLTFPREQTTASPLNGNVTPRSGARVSRNGTESPSFTPTAPTAGTRNRSASTNEGGKNSPAGTSAVGLGVSGSTLPTTSTTRPKSVAIAGSIPTLPEHTITAFDRREESISPQFFRAGNNKSVVSAQQSRPKLPAKAATFYHASASSPKATTVKTAERANSVGSPLEAKEKFFHASDAPPSKNLLAKKKSTASLVSSQKPLETRHRAKSIVRPTSPLKSQSNALELSTSPGLLTHSSATIANRTDRRQSGGSNVSSFQLPRQTTTDISGSARCQSEESASTYDILQSTRPNLPAQADTVTLSPEVLPALSPTSRTLRNSNVLSTSEIDGYDYRTIQSPTEPQSPYALGIPPQAPVSPLSSHLSSNSQPSQIERATNARRERKVLDLEISNSSLLAINKTLERELRKQSTELRRFRRLSRSGRLSILPVAALPLRSVSGMSALTTLSEDEAELDQDVDDLIDGLIDYDQDSASDSSSEPGNDNMDILSSTSSTLSPMVRTARKRRRDEKRLMFDLNRHQQLLLESQKLSQSIRRCLGWSEEMIADGRKALAYKVAVGDVKLGGRILQHDDVESEDGIANHVSEATLQQEYPSQDVVIHEEIHSLDQRQTLLEGQHSASLPYSPSPRLTTIMMEADAGGL